MIGLAWQRGVSQEAPLKSIFSDERFRTVTETVVDGLIVIDAAGLIQYVNPGCERLFLYGPGELIGKNVSVLMPSPFAEEHDNYLARHRETRVKRIIGLGRELTGLKSDGSVFPMHLSVGEAQVGDVTSFIGIIYDLTEKKRAEETILHHQKLEAIGHLSGGIAHDFNNILNVIDGNLEMIAGYDLTPPARRAVARARDGVLRAARITNRLLAFARRQPLNRQTLDLNEAVSEMTDMLRRSLGETIEVALHLAPDLDLVVTDIDQFETAIFNLGVNAKDAMPKGGLITIETENVLVENIPQTSQEIPPGNYVRVSVSDTGTGMTPEVRERAIEPFFTTKEVGQGTGLGLSMVYGFLKQADGHAQIYSEPGRGTRVSLFFPRSEEADARLAKDEPTMAALGRGETILVVEDDPDVRLVTVSRLESLGYEVRVAVSGPTALDVVRSGAAIDLALIDIVMRGGMDGHELADEIEKIAPAIKIVLSSGYSPRMANRSFQSTRPFLAKPASRTKLANLVREVLDEGPASPS